MIEIDDASKRKWYWPFKGQNYSLKLVLGKTAAMIYICYDTEVLWNSGRPGASAPLCCCVWGLLSSSLKSRLWGLGQTHLLANNRDSCSDLGPDNVASLKPHLAGNLTLDLKQATPYFCLQKKLNLLKLEKINLDH